MRSVTKLYKKLLIFEHDRGNCEICTENIDNFLSGKIDELTIRRPKTFNNYEIVFEGKKNKGINKHA